MITESNCWCDVLFRVAFSLARFCRGAARRRPRRRQATPLHHLPSSARPDSTWSRLGISGPRVRHLSRTHSLAQSPCALASPPHRAAAP